jgi:hypothetical protein
MTSYVGVEVSMQTSDEPTSSWDGAVPPKPQLGIEWPCGVTTCEIIFECGKWVIRGVSLQDEDSIAFEETISLVCWEIKGEAGGCELDCRTKDNFAIILQTLFIWPYKLPKAKEAMKAS